MNKSNYWDKILKKYTKKIKRKKVIIIDIENQLDNLLDHLDVALNCLNVPYYYYRSHPTMHKNPMIISKIKKSSLIIMRISDFQIKTKQKIMDYIKEINPNIMLLFYCKYKIDHTDWLLKILNNNKNYTSNDTSIETIKSDIKLLLQI